MARRRKKRLQKERGLTFISRENARFLAETHGRPVSVELRRDRNTNTFLDEYVVVARYADGSSHTFTGFAWGYGGEGPNGLADFLRESGAPLTQQEVFGLDPEIRGLVWSWPGRE